MSRQISQEVFAVHDRPTGRGRARTALLHAVPGTDRTRSALCGARVGGVPLPWPLTRDQTCAECAELADRLLAG